MKEETTYGHQELINQAIDYIHTLLHQTLSSEMLAMEMNMSVYHFHRLFKSYLQETISAYITRQRMERAVMYLQTRDLSLQELSEKVGYDTPQSFSKAFKRYFGFSPIAFRNTLSLVTTETTMTEDISLIGLQEPEVLLFPTMHVAYIRIIGPYGEEESYERGWGSLCDFLKEHTLQSSATRWFGISFDDPTVTQKKRCRFYACASVSQKIKPSGAIGSLTIENGSYVVYTYRGSYKGLLRAYTHIYSKEKERLRNALSFEEYVTWSKDPSEQITKIYIPIRLNQ